MTLQGFSAIDDTQQFRHRQHSEVFRALLALLWAFNIDFICSGLLFNLERLIVFSLGGGPTEFSQTS